MSQSYTETEVKLYVPDLAQVSAQLVSLGATLEAPRVFERNVRYENAEHSLSSRGIVVRLRQDNRVRLTYKEPLSDQKTVSEDDISSRFEAEVEVSDFDTMEMILGKLGYLPHLVYEKYRTTYSMDGAEIVLDELPYGNFVEIEGDTAAIRRLVPALELVSAPEFKQNYVTLFENVKRHLNLSFQDLSFDNFKGIAVPLSAFSASQNPDSA